MFTTLCVAVLVEEIYAAQKQRDAAMLDRLRTANEERDEALLKLQHLHANLQQYAIFISYVHFSLSLWTSILHV